VAQAKGILPRGNDKDVLYKSPKTCGYFVTVKLDPAIDRSRAEAWLAQVSALVDQLVLSVVSLDYVSPGFGLTRLEGIVRDPSRRSWLVSTGVASPLRVRGRASNRRGVSSPRR
jgi:hypothetical protein